MLFYNIVILFPTKCMYVILFQSYVERSNSTFNMSVWHGGKMSNSEYVETPSLSEKYYQWLTLSKITPYNHKMKHKVNTITQGQ